MWPFERVMYSSALSEKLDRADEFIVAIKACGIGVGPQQEREILGVTSLWHALDTLNPLVLFLDPEEGVLLMGEKADVDRFKAQLLRQVAES